jgi:hypothetical protein
VKRNAVLALGIAASVAETMIWHGPLGAAERSAARIETTARRVLDRLEMSQVGARLERGPLRRRLVLSGPADDFQRAQLVQILDDIPGVVDVRWASPPRLQTGGAT